MSWEDILKKYISSTRPSQKVKEVELDTSALDDKCCQEAKTEFLRQLHNSTQRANNTEELLPIEEELANNLGELSCDEFRAFLSMAVVMDVSGLNPTPMRGIPTKILQEWEECESGN